MLFLTSHSQPPAGDNPVTAPLLQMRKHRTQAPPQFSLAPTGLISCQCSNFRERGGTSGSSYNTRASLRTEQRLRIHIASKLPAAAVAAGFELHLGVTALCPEGLFSDKRSGLASLRALPVFGCDLEQGLLILRKISFKIHGPCLFAVSCDSLFIHLSLFLHLVLMPLHV